MPGVEVDGQDVREVFKVTSDAVVRARRGEGPTLIEAKTYRFDEHQVGLFIPGTPYRHAEEVEQHKKLRDPLVIFRRTLLEAGFSEAELAGIESSAVLEVREAIQFAEESPFPLASALYDYMYSHPILYPPKGAASAA